MGRLIQFIFIVMTAITFKTHFHFLVSLYQLLLFFSFFSAFCWANTVFHVLFIFSSFFLILLMASFLYVYFYLFIYLGLCWIFVAVEVFSLVVARGSYPLVVEHRLLTAVTSRCEPGSQGGCGGFSSCVSRASVIAGPLEQPQELCPWEELLRGMWDLPGPGIGEPASPAVAGRFLTTQPPGQPLLMVFLFF